MRLLACAQLCHRRTSYLTKYSLLSSGDVNDEDAMLLMGAVLMRAFGSLIASASNISGACIFYLVEVTADVVAEAAVGILARPTDEIGRASLAEDLDELILGPQHIIPHRGGRRSRIRHADKRA